MFIIIHKNYIFAIWRSHSAFAIKYTKVLCPFRSFMRAVPDVPLLCPDTDDKFVFYFLWRRLYNFIYTTNFSLLFQTRHRLITLL